MSRAAMRGAFVLTQTSPGERAHSTFRIHISLKHVGQDDAWPT
jgi:hypothetical protein